WTCRGQSQPRQTSRGPRPSRTPPCSSIDPYSKPAVSTVLPHRQFILNRARRIVHSILIRRSHRMARVVHFHQKGGPEVLRIEEVEVAPPGPDEVQIRVKAIGINRAESMFRSGPYVEDPVFPARLGYEAAGVVNAVGKNVKSFEVGESVSVIPPMSITRYGSYGELANFPAYHVVKHPTSLSWIDAAAIWMQYVTAYGALIDIARITPNDYVLITAASSSVGLAAIQIANAVGATPIAVTRS